MQFTWTTNLDVRLRVGFWLLIFFIFGIITEKRTGTFLLKTMNNEKKNNEIYTPQPLDWLTNIISCTTVITLVPVHSPMILAGRSYWIPFHSSCHSCPEQVTLLLYGRQTEASWPSGGETKQEGESLGTTTTKVIIPMTNQFMGQTLQFHIDPKALL